MSKRRTSIILTGVILLLLFTFVGLFWANYQFSLNSPGGNGFLPRWLGTRQFLIKGASPYSQEVTSEIQNQMYGRPARSTEDQGLFLYPFYSFILFAPFALIEKFSIARAIWMTVLDLALLGTIGISLYLCRWRISIWMWALVLAFLVFWIHTVRPIIDGDPSVLVAFFISAAFLAVRTEHDVLAGILLVMASIKPQMIVVLVPFVLIWAGYKGRWTLAWSFLGSLILLIIGTNFLLQDGWIMQNLRQLVTYFGYSREGSPGAIFVYWIPGIGKQMGWVLTVFMAGILFWEWRAALDQDFNWFYWTACLTLVVTNLVGVRTSTMNYAALVPALILVLATWNERWGRLGRWLVVLSIIFLFFGLWALFFNSASKGIPPNLAPFLFLALPFFLLIGLYWVRWWATRPPRLPLEDLISRVGR